MEKCTHLYTILKFEGEVNNTVTKYYLKKFSIVKYFFTSAYSEQVTYVQSFAQLKFITILQLIKVT